MRGAKLTHTTTCPRCYDKLTSSDWRPEEGLDPNLREFPCENCKTKHYRVVRNSAGKEAQLEMFGRVMPR